MKNLFMGAIGRNYPTPEMVIEVDYKNEDGEIVSLAVRCITMENNKMVLHGFRDDFTIEPKQFVRATLLELNL